MKIDRKISKIKFVGLHGHSTVGSPGDAIGYPSEHMDFAYENGMDSLALTDHGNQNGFSWQYLHAKKMQKDGKEFKPIFGVEAYYIDSIEDWKNIYDSKSEKSKVKDESAEIVEDEDETKSAKKRDPLKQRSHLVILAKNEIGLKNLFKIVSQSYSNDNFYKYPRVDFKLLESNKEGLIISTACLGGLFASKLWEFQDQGKDKVYEEILKIANKFYSVFYSDFYGELQWNSIPEQHIINDLIIKASKEIGFQLISTCDSHYPRPELWKDRILYKKISRPNSSGDNTLPMSVKEVGYELYPKNGDQMWESYKHYAALCHTVEYDDQIVLESIERTHDIAFNKIENIVFDTSVKLPSFILEEGEDALTKLTNYTIVRLKELGLNKKKNYVDRLKYELGVIHKRDFERYFLTMKKISDSAQEDRLVGAGRGSAAGSLVAYLLRITQVDPIRWGLMFERFLRPDDAKDFPDIDYDLSKPMEFKEKLKKQWGEYSVIPITNINTLKLKSLIKDVSKFYEIPYTIVNQVTTVMMDESIGPAKAKHGITAGVYEPTYEEIKEYSKSYRDFLKDYPMIESHLNNLLGQVKSYSRHAGGVLILDNLNEYLPLISSKHIMQTPWGEGQNVRHLEPFGFIKFDLLGLSTIEIIESTIERILERKKVIPTYDQRIEYENKNGEKLNIFDKVRDFYNEYLHPDQINFDDKKVYDNIFEKKNFIGMFQFSEESMQNFVVQTHPNCLMDISIATSVYRPGPLSADVDKNYIEVKKSGVINYKHPILKEVLEQTYGFIIFQEQIALIASKIGKDLSLSDGNVLRKLLIKKGTGDSSEKYNFLYSKFMAGAEELNIKKETADAIWQEMEWFSAYGFGKSHAVSYSMITYQCAWLAAYYPQEWIISVLQHESGGDVEDREKIIDEVKNYGINIKLPDIKYSTGRWEIGGKNEFVAPLTFIKGVGDKAVDEIVLNKPYNTIEDLLYNDNIKYRLLNKRMIDMLVKSEALASLADERFDNDRHFWHVVSETRGDKLVKKREGFSKEIEETRGVFDPFTKEEKIQAKISLLNYYPLDEIFNSKIENWCKDNKIKMISSIGEGKKTKTWFIIKKEFDKVTKTGKPYKLLEVTDKSHKTYKVYCWGKISLPVEVDNVYFGLVNKNDFGYSINDPENSLLSQKEVFGNE